MDSRPTERVSLTEVEAFVKANIVPARTDEIRCGDGRTRPDQSNGAIRGFGEDYGMMLAIKAALWEQGVEDVDDGKLIEAYLEAVKPERGENPKLYMHTDTHAKDHGGLGCGHARLSQLDGYILPGNKAASLYEAISARPEVDFQVLEGPHEELAALLVHSEKGPDGKRRSVNSIGQDGKGSYFVADMDGIKEHFERIAPHISAALGTSFTAEQAMRTYETQQNASAQILAISKGLELYDVNIDSTGFPAVAKISINPQE